MSKNLDGEVVTSLKQLITELSGFGDRTEPFNHIYKHFASKLKKGGTLYFLNKRDVDKNIAGMAEKFCFHGFFPQAEALQNTYKAYVSDSLPKNECMTRLNVVKLLLCLSESPTNYFLEHPELLVHERVPEEEQINWGAYLKEGIELWQPNYDDKSSEEDESVLGTLSVDERDGKDFSSVHLIPLTQIKSAEQMCVIDFKTNREELLSTIQHTWYQADQFFMEPESKHREANIGVLWENGLRDQFQGLIFLKYPNFISEYKVIREVLWQFWSPHTSSTLELSGNNLRPKPDVSLASVRPYVFYNFMSEFTGYIDLLEHFREFQQYIEADLCQNNNLVARTYQSYSNCLTEIISPIYKKLVELEEQVRQQETTYTLLNLANDLRTLFQPIQMLKEIHDEVAIDPKSGTPLKCATNLLTKLHESLHFTINKLEQDLKLTLFLGSVYHYLNLTDSWLISDDLADYTGEFVIEKVTTEGVWGDQFVIKEGVEEVCLKDSFLRIFTEKVLKIGSNINFLRLLGKYDVIGDFEDSIYAEFLNKVLEQVSKFSDNEQTKKESLVPEESECISAAVDSEICNNNSETQELEVDIDNGFLMVAFEDFFTKAPPAVIEEEISLFTRVSDVTSRLFPKANFFENVLSEIIDRRFTVSGLMVKNLLVEDHSLYRQLDFLKHLYLFHDDLIFPFYRRLFYKAESSSNRNWTNDVRLTSHLHDIFIDLYPEFYEKCSVQVDEDRGMSPDPLTACGSITIHYEMPWPLNIVVQTAQIAHYKTIFAFLLKLKWALYTINHLSFADLEGKPSQKAQKTMKLTSRRNILKGQLIRLKFCLVKVLNSVQHFTFGFVFPKHLAEFELVFERASDLGSLIDCHAKFVSALVGDVSTLAAKMNGKAANNNVFECVKLLKIMWTDRRNATLERIRACNEMFDAFLRDITPIVFPVYIYDY